MIVGQNNIKCLTDLKYNATQDDIVKIIKTKKALKSEIERERAMFKAGKITDLTNFEKNRFMLENFEKLVLPSIYNSADGHETQSAFHKNATGETNETLKSLSGKIDTIAASAKYGDGSLLSRSLDAIYDEYKDVIVSDPTDEEQQEQMNQNASNVISSGEDERVDGEDEENPMKNMSGYKQLEQWMTSIKTTESSRKKFSAITKMSDLQKVSPVEFAKPKMLLLKKIINKELYCKKPAPADRFMHTIIDCSPSMSSYQKWRNRLVSEMFESCIKLGIKFENTFWDTAIRKDETYGLKKVSNKQDLKKNILDIRPNGNGTNMGNSTIEKLKTIRRTATKQYLLVMSDGDGAIRDEAPEIYRLCGERNVELKFALFTDDSEMKNIKKEDIFQIFDNGEGSSEKNSGWNPFNMDDDD